MTRGSSCKREGREEREIGVGRTKARREHWLSAEGRGAGAVEGAAEGEVKRKERAGGCVQDGESRGGGEGRGVVEWPEEGARKRWKEHWRRVGARGEAAFLNLCPRMPLTTLICNVSSPLIAERFAISMRRCTMATSRFRPYGEYLS
ncbi:hypothetical protein KM043_015325 [Ampulex compressa]|nr:hypothetical protein KM043_015325 [Ampulex compressa]